MSIALASLTVTAGTSYTYNVGSQATVGAVVVLNESPYGLNASNGASSKWIAAQTGDVVPCDSMGFNGNLTITTDSYLDNAGSAPSFLIYFTAFAPGEALRGTYPFPLARLTSGGSVGIATQVINDNASTGSTVVEARPSGATSSAVSITNDGAAQLNSLTTNSLTVNNPANIVRTLSGGEKAFVALKPSDGTEWDIAIDASANLWFSNATHSNVVKFTNTGALGVIGGQASAGSFGAPVIVAQAINVHVTATTAQTVLTMTVPATGLYRVSGSFFSGNTGTVTPAFLLNWIGANMTGANVNTAFAAPNGIPYDGAHSIALNFDLPCWAGVFYVKGGSTLSVTYQDSSGTPNDYASALVERLS